ncbi:MAG TPA: type II toxin-antitoxin system VapB family antitoxin [Candidatus Hydrogenedentes bacterium]|nr:type II toxin-antitoxin system VapB family antitoxin [Candidatus Hydrogenedentota bacterium]
MAAPECQLSPRLRALKSGPFPTKRSAIEAGLRLLVRVNSQKRLRELRGNVAWEGDQRTRRGD